MAGEFRKNESSAGYVLPCEIMSTNEVVNMPGTDVPCDVLEWHFLDTQKYGNFKIRLLSPKNTTTCRRYWLEPLVRAWKLNENSRYLEDACSAGFNFMKTEGLLGPEEKAEKTGAEYAKLMALLFWCRNDGHVGIKRQYSSSADFVDFTNPLSPEIILPGIGIGEDENEKSNLATTQMPILTQATRILQKALKNQDGTKGASPNLEGVAKTYTDKIWPGILSTVLETANPPSTNEELLLGPRQNMLRQPQLNVEEKVRSSLIAYPEAGADLPEATANEAAMVYCLKRFVKAADDNRDDPEKFSKWLRRIREDGYLSLIRGGRKLKGIERDQARNEGRQMYLDLLWESYRSMAEFYGVIMFFVSLALQRNNRTGYVPTAEEIFLFELWHWRVDFLAGLPLSFLGRPQMRWIQPAIGMLDHDFLQARREGSTIYFPWSHTSLIPEMLNLFGMMNKMRRAADVNRKKPTTRTFFNNEGSAISDGSFEGDSGFEISGGIHHLTLEQISAWSCPECGSSDLTLESTAPRSPTNPMEARAILFCNDCARYFRCTVTISQ